MVLREAVSGHSPKRLFVAVETVLSKKPGLLCGGAFYLQHLGRLERSHSVQDETNS